MWVYPLLWPLGSNHVNDDAVHHHHHAHVHRRRRPDRARRPDHVHPDVHRLVRARPDPVVHLLDHAVPRPDHALPDHVVPHPDRARPDHDVPRRDHGHLVRLEVPHHEVADALGETLSYNYAPVRENTMVGRMVELFRGRLRGCLYRDGWMVLSISCHHK
ncbi:hypothetical protein L1049_016989 [Liquidambar formosana]|uniref:Uncharacterized protein n=1 Tax=Liquidambar formosana TaxID=63359 RepID=A0AAP0S765_LIQFO